tara:strand:- start:44435 stop:44761 length:327 start_codon:yes stop_codon:yes gene_type:complete
MTIGQENERVKGWDKMRIVDLAMIVSVLRGMPPEYDELIYRMRHFFGNIEDSKFTEILGEMKNAGLLSANNVGLCPTQHALDLATYLYPKITALVEAKIEFGPQGELS